MGRKLSLERFAERGLAATDRVVEQLRPLVRPLGSDRDLDPLMQRVGDARCVLLGEASHGTSEFYTWRARITRRLIEEKGFRFVAVEGDWPDCYRVNRFVRGMPNVGVSAEAVLHTFDRWPTWMWANREVAAFTRWLRAHNDVRPPDERVGFYGLDVYSLWDSMRAVTHYLDRVDPEAARKARRAYECFAPYGEDEQEYARATALVPTSCEPSVVKALAELRAQAPTHESDGGREAYFEAEQNAIDRARRRWSTRRRGLPGRSAAARARGGGGGRRGRGPAPTVGARPSGRARRPVRLGAAPAGRGSRRGCGGGGSPACGARPPGGRAPGRGPRAAALPRRRRRRRAGEAPRW